MKIISFAPSGLMIWNIYIMSICITDVLFSTNTLIFYITSTRIINNFSQLTQLFSTYQKHRLLTKYCQLTHLLFIYETHESFIWKIWINHSDWDIFTHSCQHHLYLIFENLILFSIFSVWVLLLSNFLLQVLSHVLFE